MAKIISMIICKMSEAIFTKIALDRFLRFSCVSLNIHFTNKNPEYKPGSDTKVETTWRPINVSTAEFETLGLPLYD